MRPSCDALKAGATIAPLTQKGMLTTLSDSFKEFFAIGNKMNDEQTNFKVTDRRLFNSDGSPREVPENQKSEPQPSTNAAQPNIASAPAEAQPSAAATQRQNDAEPELSAAEDPDLAGDEDPASFVNFLMSIASNAASALGMMEHPVTHQREVDLELAKHWIDVLGMLQRKTQGNLSTQEAKILEGFLADLRMQFVSLTNSATPKASRTYSGRDIVGG
jgi:hypothetical protein